jgi:thiamine-monophosphate kinase
VAYDEFSLIREWTSRSAGEEGDGLSVGLGDDAAVFAVSAGMEVVACCDAMIETVHFLRETMKPEDIGYKGMISNISDIAAMGGIPRFALVTIGVSPNWTAAECKAIYDGIYEAAKEYGVRLIGGDTVSTPDALHLSITLLGEVESGRALRRSSAKPGDIVFVTGPLGGSAAGLHLLLAHRETGGGIEERWQSLARLHQRPTAQVEAGRLLLTSNLAGALNDISDGLASELWEIAEASGVSALIEREQIPLAEPVSQYAGLAGKDPLDWAFFGGEDYQLVGTVAEAAADSLAKQFAGRGLPFYPIGKIVAGTANVLVRAEDGTLRQLPKAGYNHFQRD